MQKESFRNDTSSGNFSRMGQDRNILRRKGQVTIFIIIALIVVGIVLVLLLWPSIKTVFVKEIPPDEFVKSCMQKNVEEAVDLAGKRGGSIKPEFGVSYDGESVEYLCYTNQFYQTCVMQQPMLKQHIEYEIANYAKPRIEECVASLKGEMEKRGYTFSNKRPDLTLSINPKGIRASVEGKITVTKNEETKEYDNFNVNVNSGIYDLIMIAGSVLNYEARIGDADPLVYMFYYPNLRAQKVRQDDGTKIYLLQDRDTGEELRFASRSLSWPAGYTGTDNLALYPGRAG